MNAAAAMDAVRELVAGRWRVGRTRSSGPLTIVSVFGSAPAPDYQTGPEAFSAGTLTVQEIGGGLVPQLLARNRAAAPVLLIDGEHLVGAKQDRIVNTSILLAAGRDTRLPVTCVEQGRWAYRDKADLASSKETAFTHLRALNKTAVAASLRAGRGHASDQGVAWSVVSDHLSHLVGKMGPSTAMAEGHAARTDDVEAILAGLAEPEPGQTGALVCVDGRMIALDAFDKAATLEKLWSRLLAGYALDAIEVSSERGATSAPEPAAPERFLRSLLGGVATVHDGVGVGVDVLITSPETTASALVWEGVVVHVAAFAEQRIGRGRPQGSGTDARIEGPERRARMRRYFHHP